MGAVGGGGGGGGLLTVKYVVIIVCCPLVYLPLEDSGLLLMTIGPDNQLSMCPLSDVIYITRLPLLCCPLSACNQSFAAETQNRPLTKQTVNVVDCLLRRLKILIVSDLYRNKATLTLRGSTRWTTLR